MTEKIAGSHRAIIALKRYVAFVRRACSAFQLTTAQQKGNPI